MTPRPDRPTPPHPYVTHGELDATLLIINHEIKKISDQLIPACQTLAEIQKEREEQAKKDINRGWEDWMLRLSVKGIAGCLFVLSLASFPQLYNLYVLAKAAMK